MDNNRMNTGAIITLIIFVSLLIAAMYVGNWFLVLVTKRPLEQIPAILKFIVHGITLGFIFAIGKRYVIK